MRKELREKTKEIEELGRKTINDKRELQGLIIVRWSGKGKENKRLNIIINNCLLSIIHSFVVYKFNHCYDSR